MSRTLRCLLLVAVLLAGGAFAARTEAGPGAAAGHQRGAQGGATVVLAGDLLDTSWGDDHIRPSL
ncbi:hypothetical protein [Streptomyces sp. NBC_01408]|uniref:hypothetical protein n=1 Tax=Streptomyces sp. NBC_01408 TaxID=2903855 RepID=UPI002254CB9F|nr:hypothetical protein [Streptomyces sp. NBC_01408]MCX4696188.1 hypothetical protein [Streptomyces sp. NBC_01408]